MSPGSYYGRCRMHGGISPGAPKGNANAFKHRHYTAEAIATGARLRSCSPCAFRWDPLRFQAPPAINGTPLDFSDRRPPAPPARSDRPVGWDTDTLRVGARVRHDTPRFPPGADIGREGDPLGSREGRRHIHVRPARSIFSNALNLCRSACGLGPLAVTILPVPLAGRAAATATVAPPCNRQRPFFVAGDRQGSSVRETESFINSALGKWGQVERRLTGRNKWT
jgi:hypothetical protein